MRQRARSRLGWLFAWSLGSFLLLSSVTPAPLQAAPKKNEAPGKDAARAAFTAANRHYQLSEYAQALDKFKDAFRLYPDPSFLYNIAQCQRLLGQKDEAVRSYKSYLRNAGDTPLRDEVTTMIGLLEKDIADQAKIKAAEAEQARLKAEADAEAERQRQANVGSNPPRDDKPRKPLIKQWWFWTAIGGGVVLAVGLGAGLGYYYSRPTAVDFSLSSRSNGLSIAF